MNRWAEPRERTVTDRPRPDFFIVGHPKCGTTALHTMLRAHPQIFMPEVKEPRFFAPDVIPRTRTLDEYLALFAGGQAGQILGEADPHSLASRLAAPAIAAHNPAARVIALYREPAAFLHSLHLQRLRSRPETPKDLASALDLYLDYTRYAEQLRRYREALPADQILVLVYEEFRRDNAATVRRVLEFLGVDASYPIDMVEANPSFATRSAADTLLRRALNADGPAARASKRVLRTVTPRSVRRAAILGFRQHVVRAPAPPPDAAVIDELRGRLKPEVVRLGDLLGRDLVTLWGYDNARSEGLRCR